MWLPLVCPPPWTWPATQACALTGNRTGNTLVHRPALNPLNHTSQAKGPLLNVKMFNNCYENLTPWEGGGRKLRTDCPQHEAATGEGLGGASWCSPTGAPRLPRGASTGPRVSSPSLGCFLARRTDDTTSLRGPLVKRGWHSLIHSAAFIGACCLPHRPRSWGDSGGGRACWSIGSKGKTGEEA